MQFNTDPTFVGIEPLKQRYADQIAQFEIWAANHRWETFHSSHYDWWTFPINRPSAYGMQYVVFEGEIKTLREDREFMNRYRLGVSLVAASWGWDVWKAGYIADPEPGQSWHNWPVRLFKAALSVQLFAETELFESLKKYALDLIRQNQTMSYGGKDLSWLFTTGKDPYHFFWLFQIKRAVDTARRRVENITRR